ncbi:MAG: hypothetical protein ACP5HQ_02000 [Thermoprotei archaeon]
MIAEGYFLKYKGCFWAVKGCRHPEGFAVAVPRKCGGIKVKRLTDALALVRARFPDLLRHDEVIGYPVPMVPLKEAEVLDPFEAEVKDPTARKFLDFFPGEVGVTGSLLYDEEHNDMDFLSFDSSHYTVLKRLREEGVTSPLEEVNIKEVEGLTEDCFRRLKARRVLEGVFEGEPYTFKIVQCVEEGRVVKEREFNGRVTIKRAVKPYSLPVIYEVGGDLSGFAKSYRIRFTELSEGLTLLVSGRVQVREKDFVELSLDLADRVECS